MKTSLSSSWPLRLITLTVWLVAVLCGVYWAMKFVTVKPVTANSAAIAPAVVVDSAAVAKLLGATNSIAGQAVTTPASSNYALFGLAVTGSGTGVALIATDGKPAKPYRVGSKVADDWVLKSVSRTEAILATAVNAPDGMKLELPARRPASVGVGATVGAAPGVVTPQVGGLPGTTAANPVPAGQLPLAFDPSTRRPVSRFAPLPQSELSTSGRVPAPSASSAVVPVPAVKP
jgi:general secretion pathway protein C